jgi:hypothetical protein
MLPEWITTDPEKLKAIWVWPTPKNKHEIRSFLGLCIDYKWFISCFGNIVRPLTKLMEEKQAFQWTPEVEATFKTLQEVVCTASILAYLQPGERFIVDTDLSNVGIGGVLSKVQDRKEQIIAYDSKTLNKPKRNYCVTWQELLAIARTLEHFHKYLYGQEIHLCTDHSSLTWLVSSKNLKGKTAHWIQCL